MDQTLFHLINERWTNPALDLFMAGLSDSAIWKPFLIFVVVVVFVFGEFRARACIFSILVTLAIVELVTGVLKSAVDRPRPKQVQSVRMVQLQKARPRFLTLFKKPLIRYSDLADRDRAGPSFPSGHMANNTAIAVCLTVFYRRRGALYGILTAAIGYSRVYVGAHWPSDIVGTFFLATGEALIAIAFLELTWRTAARRLAPETFARHSSLIVDSPGRARPPGAPLSHHD